MPCRDHKRMTGKSIGLQGHPLCVCALLLQGRRGLPLAGWLYRSRRRPMRRVAPRGESLRMEFTPVLLMYQLSSGWR